jgi:hypothetical protein
VVATGPAALLYELRKSGTNFSAFKNSRFLSLHSFLSIISRLRYMSGAGLDFGALELPSVRARCSVLNIAATLSNGTQVQSGRVPRHFG